MTTRSLVARPTTDAGFAGRYVHRDGDPDTQLQALRHYVTHRHAGDVDAALTVLIDDHPFGWVSLPDAEDDGQCFCHGDSTLDTGTHTERGSAGGDLEYAYVLRPDGISVLVPGPGDAWRPLLFAAWTD
ncbi:hypothetical protein ACFYWS_20735 [Streptomyces sp. NPDC002795]|uniref:hypothetical protein n=1 Tax=Streptomyces sp. NPDC002795 TaxID=3364665 RepID=UPI003677A0F4